MRAPAARPSPPEGVGCANISAILELVKVLQAYRYALDPTPRQKRALASHVGAARFVYNWGLELVKERLDARARGEDVEVPWTLPALRR
jgi:putative transposase